MDSCLDPGRYRRIQFRELMQSSETMRTQRLRLLVHGAACTSLYSSFDAGTNAVSMLIDFPRSKVTST